MNVIWKCPKCKRVFQKKNQGHSCTVYPVEKHLKNKDYAKKLYNELKKIIGKKIGKFSIESLPCCIHFVATATNYTFMCVYALKNGIKIHFTLPTTVNSSRLQRYSKMSSQRYLYELNIKTTGEIDSELIAWLKKAYKMKKMNK
jgi:hypothetical protein